MIVKTRIIYEPMFDDFKVAILTTSFDGKRYILKNTKFIEYNPYELPIVEPTLDINQEGIGIDNKTIIQSIMDAAWEEGMRPIGFRDIKNETTALKNHLNDMRRLVFANTTPYNIVELE